MVDLNLLVLFICFLCKNPDFVKFFGISNIPDRINNFENDIKFESKFNWDIILSHGSHSFTLSSNQEAELIEKNNYKLIYNKKVLEVYEQKCKEYDTKITIREQLNDIYLKKYKNDLNYYMENFKTNEREVASYEKKLSIYKNNKSNLNKLVCKNYAKYLI